VNKKILGIAIKCFFCLLLISGFAIADSPEKVKNKRKQAEEKFEKNKIEAEIELHKTEQEVRQAEKELRKAKRNAGKTN
jgi:hypothetical protein